MTEREKSMKGLPHQPWKDDIMKEELKNCKDLCYTYNNILPSKIDEKKEVMEKILGKIHGNFVIGQSFWCDYGYNIEIGNNFYSNHNLVILDCAKVTFGDNVFIAPNCGFYTASHPLDKEERNEVIVVAKPIKVGNNVWIGGNVTVLPGVEIGDDTIIGAGSVVTKSIPEGVIAVGNPCRVVRKITEEDKMKNIK